MPDQTLAQRIKAKYPGEYDDLPDAVLEGKIHAKYPGVYADIPRTQPGPNDFMPAAPRGSASSRALAGLARSPLNPVNAVSGIAQALLHPIDTATGIMDSHVDQFREGLAAARRGGVQGNVEAFGHGLAATIPVIGPAAAQVGTRLSEAFERGGDVAGAVGEGVGLAASVPVLPRVAKGAVKAAPAIARGARNAVPTVAGGVVGGVGGAMIGRPIRGAIKGAQVGREIGKMIDARNTPLVDPPMTPSVIAESNAILDRAIARGRADGQARAAAVAPPAAPGPPSAPAVPPGPPPAPASRSTTASAAESAPVAPAPRISPKVMNETRLAEIRSKTDLTEPERAAAYPRVVSGEDPTAVVADIAARRSEAPAVTKPSKAKWSGADLKAFVEYKRRGMPEADAFAAVEAQRALAAKLGTPSVAEMHKRMADLKATKYKR